MDPYDRGMGIRRLEHVGIVVGDLAAATEFFVALGFELEGEASVEGDWVDRVIGIDGARSDIVMLQTPDGDGRVELTGFQSPSARQGDADAQSNILGIRHLAFTVDDIDAAVENVRAHGGELVGTLERYRDIYRLCYVRGPEGIILELAEELR
jgi:catechol 2,3-dioxygenase-like lactoylglutathione lyase family enzyme